jgi:hypothetical protein
MEMRKSIQDTAKLLLINAKFYEEEKGKEVSRHRISTHTLKRISKRQALREGFIKSLTDELAELGWIFIKLDDQFAIIDSKKIEAWVKLSSKRLSENHYFDLQSDCLEEKFYEMFPIDLSDDLE